MLIRGETTEDRIAKIAQGFGQGVQNFIGQQDRQRSQQMQDEAVRRQQALQAFEIENRIAETTGRIAAPGTGLAILNSENLDLSGALGDKTFKAKQLEDQAARQSQKDALDSEYKRSQIAKNNNTAVNPPMTYEQKLDLKMRKDQEAKAIEKQSPEYKLERLGAEGGSKVGALASGLQALDQMVKASSDGYGPEYINANTSLIGGLVSDTPYSEGERMVSEVIGRLQSGGAIQGDEKKTFIALGPRPGDDGPTRERKLAQQKDFLNNKLTAFGISDKDLSALNFKTTSDYVPRNPPVSTKGNVPKVNEKQISQIKSMSDEELIKFIQGG